MLKITNLDKYYGSQKILNNVNLHLEKGVILGLLGPNGSGKTTLIKTILNLSSIKSGSIVINGEERSKLTNKYISYLPDINYLNVDKKVFQALEEQALFYEDFDIEKASLLLSKLKINSNSTIKSLSKGMQEKLLLILTLSRKAKLYILDEPIAGVDIVTRKNILKLIIENIYENSSVIITTHLIKDIEQIFDGVCFINDGVVSKIYDVAEIREDEFISVEDLYLKEFGGDLDA